jgi:hypothetical protein
MRFSTFKIKEVGITTEIAVFHIFDFIFFEIIHSFQYVSNFWWIIFHKNRSIFPDNMWITQYELFKIYIYGLSTIIANGILIYF